MRALPLAFEGRKWIELALDYRCNLRCLGCHACHDTGERLSSSEAVSLLRAGRDRGIDSLWLGGGEPTLRDDLLSLVRAARAMGYVAVVVQTNGMRLSYAAYRDALLAAGVTEVRLNVKSHRAEVHDRLSGGEPCHALLLDAIAGLAKAGTKMTADVLLTKTSAPDLPALVPFYAERGVAAFDLWLLSAWDAPEAAGEVPRIADLVPLLAEATGAAKSHGVRLASFHTPPCTLPPELRSLFSPAGELSLLVVGPDRRPFPLEASPFEGGAYLEGCARCAERPRCGGPRPDYVKLYGDGEFVAIPRV